METIENIYYSTLAMKFDVAGLFRSDKVDGCEKHDGKWRRAAGTLRGRGRGACRGGEWEKGGGSASEREKSSIFNYFVYDYHHHHPFLST